MNFIHSLPQIPSFSLSTFRLSVFLQNTKTMALCRSLYRPTTQIAKTVRFASTSSGSTTKPSHHNHHQQNHEFLEPNSFIGSWEATRDPKEAQSRLAQLRRNYAKQVKELRKEYIREVELMRLEKLRKDEARREALRVQNEERKKQKAEVAKARAQERQVAEQEFHQTLLKERAEKLENWRMKENRREEKKKEKNELLHRQSSLWIDDSNLESKILEAIVDTTSL